MNGGDIFKRVLNKYGRLEVGENGGGVKASSGFEFLNKAMIREQVEHALDRLKEK